MRRGQMFSIDAIISLVLIIMILGTVTSTSENLRNSITFLVTWYEDANVGTNMLEVLLRSPGDPVNWPEDPESLRVPGMRDSNSPSIEYDRLEGFWHLLATGNEKVLSALKNLSMGRNFILAFYTQSLEINVTIEIEENGDLVVQKLNVTWLYPSTEWGKIENYTLAILYLDGTFHINPSSLRETISDALKNSENVMSTSTLASVKILNYSRSIKISSNTNKRIISGVLTSKIPPSSTITFNLPPDEDGYTVFVILDGDRTKVLGIWKKNPTSSIKAALWTLREDGSLEHKELVPYSSNSTDIVLRWDQLISNPNDLTGERIVELIFYQKSFTGNVSIRDNGNIGLLLKPKFESLYVRLWVWGR